MKVSATSNAVVKRTHAVAAATHDSAIADEPVDDLAARLEYLLPALMRQMLGTPSDHPLSALPLAQLRLCTLLLRDGRRTMSQIGDDLRISVSAVTQMADRLEKVGMVERVAATEGDRRTRHLQLTTHGTALMDSRRATRVSRAAIVVRALTPAQRTEALAMLETLMEASRSLPPTPVYFESSL